MYVCACPVGAINIGFTTVETSSIAPRVYVPRATGTSSKLHRPCHPSSLLPTTAARSFDQICIADRYDSSPGFYDGSPLSFAVGRKEAAIVCVLSNERIREMNRDIFGMCSEGM